MEYEPHGLRMIRGAGRSDVDHDELKTGIEQQEQAEPKKEAQANDKKRPQPRRRKQLSQLCARYLISKPPQELRFALFAGQSARVGIPLGNAVNRRMNG